MSNISPENLEKLRLIHKILHMDPKFSKLQSTAAFQIVDQLLADIVGCG